ncbi:MAG: tetratricopeptide repeat protein [Pseudomonadota bacterium]
MPYLKYRPVSIFSTLIIFSALIFFIIPSPAAETVQPVGDSGATRVNQEAVEKLKKMSPEEIRNLDEFMARALTLYYDRKFAQALPIFKEIAGKVETMDIMFWLGTSAAKAGEADLAVAEFEKMLLIDPGLNRVRLELASVYFATGRNEEARRELQTVLATDPPPEVKANINSMLTAIEERTRKWSWNLRLGLGYMYDDNITAVPDPGVYSLPGGSSFRPAPTSAKLSDNALVASFAGNALYDFGEKRGLMWNTGTSAYFKGYDTYGQFDYSAVDINTGPWWVQRRSVLKIPLGYTYTEYGSDRLSEIMHIDPSYEYFFNDKFSLKGTYIYKDERFFDDFRTAFDNVAHLIELAPTVYLGNRRHMITGSVAYDDHDAQSDFYTYRAPILGINYFTRFPTKTELYLGCQWTRRDYPNAQPFRMPDSCARIPASTTRRC